MKIEIHFDLYQTLFFKWPDFTLKTAFLIFFSHLPQKAKKRGDITLCAQSEAKYCYIYWKNIPFVFFCEKIK